MISSILRPIAVALLASAGATAFAQTSPRFSGNIELPLQADYVHDADVGRDRGVPRYAYDVYTEALANMTATFGNGWSATTSLAFEPVRTVTRDRIFQDHGLFAEQIFASYSARGATLYAGKFNLPFGTAWRTAPGVYGPDFAEDYEIKEQIGIGGSIQTVTGGADLIWHGAVFFADTTVLSNSLFTHPRRGESDVNRLDRQSRRDGGGGNTGRLDNIVFAVEGRDIPGFAGLAWQAALLYRQRGITEPDDEQAGVASLAYSTVLNPIKLTALGEVAGFRNLQGGPQNATYVTLAVEAGLPHGLRGSISHTLRRLDEPSDGSGPNGRDVTDRLWALSLGYDLSDNLDVAVGWKAERVAGVDVATVGLLLTYRFAFGERP